MKLSLAFSLYFLFTCSCFSFAQNNFKVHDHKIILPIKNECGTFSFIDTSGLKFNTDSFKNVKALPNFNLYLIKQKNKWGASFFDQMVLDFEYDTIYNCGSELILKTIDSTFLFSTKSFKKIARFSALDVYIFNNDYKYYSIIKNNKKGLIKVDGTVILQPKYNAIIKINNYFIFNDSIGNYGAINASGKPIIKPQNKFIYAYNDSILRHKKSNGWKYFKPNGEDFKTTGKFELELMKLNFYKVYKNNKIFLHDFETDELLDVDKFENYYPITNKLISVLKDSKIGLVDIDMNIIIPFEYEEISFFNHELLLVKSNDKYGLINLKNESIISCDYELLVSSNNLITSYKNGKAGLHLNNGKQVISNLFKGILSWHNLYITYNDRFYGVYDNNFKLISKPIYSTLTYLHEKKITIMKYANKFTIYNKEGRISEDKVDQFTITNNTIKTYKENDIEIITLDLEGEVTNHEKYPNMISVKINEKTKKDTYKWYKSKYYPPATYLYQSQLKGKWGIKNQFKKGYKLAPSYTQIYPTSHSKKFIVKDSTKVFNLNIGDIKLKVNELISAIDGSSLHWNKNSLIDIYTPKYCRKKCSSNHVISTDSLGNACFANDKNKMITFSDEFLSSDVKRFNTGGKITISSSNGFEQKPSLSNYINRLNAFSNLTIEDSISKKEIFDQNNYLNINGGKWFYKDYGKYISNIFTNYFFGLKEYDKADVFSGNRSIVYSGNKAGVINLKNEIIIPIEYSNLEVIKTNKFRYFKSHMPDQRFFYTNEKKGIIIPFFIPIVNENKFGLIYKHLGKYGIIDNNGKVKSCAQYKFLEDVKNQKVIIAKKDSFGLITRSGKEISEFKYSLIQRKSDSLFLAFKGNKKTIINSRGKQVLPNKYQLKQCDFNLILAKDIDRINVFNHLGENIFSQKKDLKIKILSSELISVKKGKKIKIFNIKKSQYIIYKNLQSAKSINNEHLIFCASKKGHSILKNNGEYLLQNQEKIKVLKNGWFTVKNNKKWSIYNSNGEMKISNISKLLNSDNSIINYLLNDEIKSINSTTSNTISKSTFHKVKKPEKLGLLSFTNDTIFPTVYNKLELISDNIFYTQDDVNEAYYIVENKKKRLLWQRTLPRYKEEEKFNCEY